MIERIKRNIKRAIEYSKLYSKMWGGLSEKYLILNCLENVLLGKCTIRDYYIYGFPFLNNRGKKEYISNLDMLRWNKNNSKTEALGILDEKEKALMKFEAYIHRDWVGKSKHNLESDYKEFLENNTKCIAKPIEGTCGNGIHIVNLEDKSVNDVKKLCERDYILEELIIQHERLSMLYPNSVNTIRIGTLYGEIIGATLRIGSGKAEIDNFSSGGIAANIDVDSGIVVSIGKDQYGNKYVKHPDTGIAIPGLVIPFWNECKNFAKDLSKEIQGMPFVGWDVAITNEGPTFIEANEESEIAVFQYAQCRGLRKEINDIIRKKGMHRVL